MTRPGPNDREHATFYTRTDGYERWQDYADGSVTGVLVHRLLAVATFGFDGVRGMDVHHQNGIPWDNRPSNLEVMSRSQHIRQHRAEEHGHDADDAPWRDEEKLRRAYEIEGLSTYEIADRWECNNVTVWKWLKRFDIPTRSKAGTEVAS